MLPRWSSESAPHQLLYQDTFVQINARVWLGDHQFSFVCFSNPGVALSATIEPCVVVRLGRSLMVSIIGCYAGFLHQLYFSCYIKIPSFRSIQEYATIEPCVVVRLGRSLMVSYHELSRWVSTPALLQLLHQDTLVQINTRVWLGDHQLLLV